jgi:hypothetical protein
MVLEFQRAERMGDAFDGIRLPMREVVTRIDLPFRAGARMVCMQDAIHHGIAQVDVAGSHVDLGAQHARAVREFTGPHAAEQIEIFLHASVAERTVLARLGQCAAVDAHLGRRLVVDIGLAGADQVLRPFIQLLEIVRRMEKVLAPVEAEPMYVGFDRVDVFLLFPGRVRVVETQMAAAAEFLGGAEIERDRLGMTNMQIAVRLRRKARHDSGMPLGLEIGLHDVANEIAPNLPRAVVTCGHTFIP